MIKSINLFHGFVSVGVKTEDILLCVTTVLNS